MAPRKGIPAPPARKTPAKTTAERRPAGPPATITSDNPNRLLREAAWSQMFGRVESKNPFSR